MTEMEIVEDLWALLTHASKLERDKAVKRLEAVLDTNDNEWTVWIMDQLLRNSKDLADSPWEFRLGFMQAAKVFFAKARTDGRRELSEVLINVSVDHLADPVVRVRSSAGDLLGELCRSMGSGVYETARDRVLEMIRTNLEACEHETTRMEEAVAKGGKEMSKVIDKAEWKKMEMWEPFAKTSMKALEQMVEGCGVGFQSYLDQSLLDLVTPSFCHANCFVREAGYGVLASFVGAGSASFIGDKFGSQFAQHIAKGLTDKWSQARLSASVACRRFLLLEQSDRARMEEEFLPLLLPPLCLNRYYGGNEGVSIYSQDTWKTVVGSDGCSLVEKQIVAFVNLYATAARTTSESLATREAACHCIAELAIKIDRQALSGHVPLLTDAVLVCLKDDSWLVRTVACTAARHLVKTFPEESRPKLQTLCSVLVANVRHPVTSVRQSAAVALAGAVQAYGGDLVDTVIQIARDGWKGLADQQPTVQAVVARATTPDGIADAGEKVVCVQPRSVSQPNMHHIGEEGQEERQHVAEPWELADGCVHLYAELTAIKPLAPKLHHLLVPLSSACRERHYPMHLAFIRSVMDRLPEVASNLDKRLFKPYLEELMEPVFYACSRQLEDEAASTRSSGERVLAFLNVYLGPSILRGRVEKYHARYLGIFEQVIVRIPPTNLEEEESGEGGSHSRSAPVGIPSKRDQNPTLGGTPK